LGNRSLHCFALFWGDEFRLFDCFGGSAATGSAEVVATDFPDVGAATLAADPGETGVECVLLLFCVATEAVLVVTEVCEGISLSQTCVDISFIEDDFKTVAYDGRSGLGILYILLSFLASW
jgi:hypothetical protein